MKAIRILSLAAAVLLPGLAARAAEPRPRLAVLTDIGGDPDDQQSMIRLMVYANEFEIEALVASASGTRGELKKAVTRPDLIREIIGGYERVLPNIKRHAAGWPEAEQLRRRVKSGNPQRAREAIGEGRDTEGSRLLIERMDAGTPERPLNIAIWGGQTDLAQALWRVKHDRGAAGLAALVRKFRVYDISDQDGIAGWMRGEFPGMNYILAQAPAGRDKREGTYRGMYLTGDESLTSREWVERNVRATGPLGALYPTKTSTAPNKHGCLKEGDTPSWFFFLPRGGNDPRDPAKPGWGGQFRREPDGWWRDLPAENGFDPRTTVSRWRADFQRDFAKRMAWCRPDRPEPSLPRLRVSDNGRFLVTAEGKPFFWLGDTAWHMFGKSARETSASQPGASLYFANRAAKGFTVIQSVIVRWPDGGSMANAYGFDPFENGDRTRPRLRPGENDDYWDHVDWCVAEAARHGLYLAALPLWLSAIEEKHPLVRDPRVAYRYGRFLGARYGKEPHLIWVLGGDAPKGRNVDNPARLAMIRSLAEGIADGANGLDRSDGQADWTSTLMTFHPPGGDRSSSEWLHAEPWLDFNMIQTTTRFNFENWRTVAKDYALDPPKPTLDAEVAYEDSLSLRKTEPQDRRIRPWDARRAAYWNVFAGGFGHTYGHRSFIAWIRKGETYKWGAHIPWYESLDAPGAVQMGHLRRLMESRPFLTRIPDPSLLVGDAGTGAEHVQATRDAEGSYAMVYSPSGGPFKVRMDKITDGKVRASWFDPRSGEATVIGEFPNTGERAFTPPASGDGNDWVLLLDDSTKIRLPAAGVAEPTDWFHQAGWGVMTHYLGAPPSSDGGAELTAEAWNRQVDAFDVPGLAAQLASTGAKYLLFTIGQNSGHYCSPNATYDRLVGIAPSKCSRRDLVADLAKALGARGIRLMVYLPSGAPGADPVARQALGWRWGRKGHWQLPGEDVGGRLADFQRKWEAIIREWSLRWGTSVSGWWIDGCYFADEMYRFDEEPNFASFAAALKAGNPQSIVAFNPGVKVPVIGLSRWEDYTAGEVTLAKLAQAVDACPGRWLECEGRRLQFQILTYLGTSWCRGDRPAESDQQVIDVARRLWAKGGVVTFDVPIEKSGLIPAPFVDQLRAIGAAR